VRLCSGDVREVMNLNASESILGRPSHASSPPVVHPFPLFSSTSSFRNNAATLTFLFGSLVPIAVGLILGHSRVGQQFVEVLTAEYEGRLLTTDVECEVVSSLDNSVVLGGRAGFSASKELFFDKLIFFCIELSRFLCQH
jgi:hypothetical protein